MGAGRRAGFLLLLFLLFPLLEYTVGVEDSFVCVCVCPLRERERSLKKERDMQRLKSQAPSSALACADTFM